MIRWGRFTLDIFYNPGKTLSSLNVDIPEGDLLIVGDEIFGNTVFLSSAGVPEMFFRAIDRLQGRGRSRVIPGHMSVFSGRSLENAKSYLGSLQAQVEAARNSPSAANSILRIPIESCLAPQVEASDLEREFHQINLRLIIERELFITPA
jgi:glyoxylase-like metal-dependent hydrolase (beta-lactamase superfamily II)